MRTETTMPQEHLDKKVNEFGAYLDAELAVLDAAKNYQTAHRLINELQTRATRFIDAEMLSLDGQREDYLKSIVSVVQRADEYSARDDSLPQEIGARLQGLSRHILTLM